MHLVMIELFFSEGFMTIFAKQFGPILTWLVVHYGF